MGFNAGVSTSSIATSTDVALSNIQNAQILTYNASQGKWQNTTQTGGASNATASTPGSVQLAGDLSGTATAPTVPGLAIIQNSAIGLSFILGA